MKRTLFVIPLILLMCFSLLPLSFLTQAQSTRTAAPRPRGQSVQQIDGGWPRAYSLPSEAQVIIFQPQIASWDDQKHMVALSAVSYVPKDEQKPALGTIKIEADTSVALEQRLVKFQTLKITEAIGAS